MASDVKYDNPYHHDLELDRAIQTIDAQRALLARAIEAMTKVPHLMRAAQWSEVICTGPPDSLLHEQHQCARLGGACAFTKLIEEIERG